VSNGPVAKLKVTGVAASRHTIGTARKPSRHNCELRWSRWRLFIRRCARYLWWKCINGHSVSGPRPMYITCIDDASIFHRKVPKRWRRGQPPPSTYKSTTFKSVTEKIRSDVLHLLQCRSILSVLDWGIDDFWRRRRVSRFTTHVLRMIKIYFK